MQQQASNRKSYLLIITLETSPRPSQIPHILFDIISLDVDAVLCLTNCSSFYLPRRDRSQSRSCPLQDRTQTSSAHEQTCVLEANALTDWASQADSHGEVNPFRRRKPQTENQSLTALWEGILLITGGCFRSINPIYLEVVSGRAFSVKTCAPNNKKIHRITK